MCGITGHVVPRGRRPDTDAVRRALARLAHRGPNGSGIAEFESTCVGHRRLSIIDIAGSPQPWSSEDGRYTITYNGEIYNYIELRKQLVADGFRFCTQGDTEVLLAMYLRDGERCLEQLNGMFAFAIWDNVARRLFVARDRLGKKPLFYALVDGGFVFASEIEPLLVFPNIDTTLDAHAVQDFLAYQFIPSPRTIYRSIRKLPAAHFLYYCEGKLDITRYWKPPLPLEHHEPETTLGEELRSLLRDAVRLRLRSDVPLGAFLSGGIDSSIVVGVMKELGVDVDTYHVGFDTASYDETAHARQAAEYFGTRHHSQILPVDYDAVLDSATHHFGEPFADPSAIPTWHLCRHTRASVTVALSGDGADELFAGYRRYYARKFVDLYLMLPRGLRAGLVQHVLRFIPATSGYYATSQLKKLRLFIDLAERTAIARNDLLAQTFSPLERRALLAEHISVKAADHIDEFHLEHLDSISQMMFTDIQVYLPDDILVKVDRMSMAHSLEVRNPFLDHRLVEFACRLPLSWKLKGRTQKRILRTAFKDMLPPALRNREKHGFAVPLGDWFRTTLAGAFEEIVLDATATDFFNRDNIVALWQAHSRGQIDHGFKLWSLFVFHRWYHMQRKQ